MYEAKPSENCRGRREPNGFLSQHPAVLDQPSQGWVSLRATAVDKAGNQAVQTIVHAWALRLHVEDEPSAALELSADAR